MRAAVRRPASFDDADRQLAGVLDSLAGAVNYADWIVELARPHLGHDVLEVGAGHGTLTERLAAEGRRVTAADLSERCVATLAERFGDRSEIDVVHGDIETAVSGRTYDSAVLVNVLEHIPDDAAALRTLYRGVRSGGSVVVFVPAFEALYSEFDRLIGHHRRYRRAPLAEAVSAAGFQVVEARYVNALGGAAWWLVTRQLGRFPSGRSVRAYDRMAMPLVRRLESRWAPPFGQSVLCIGRRPAGSAV